MRLATSAQAWLTAATLAASSPCWATRGEPPRAARLLADSGTAAAQSEPYAPTRMIAVTLVAPLGGLVLGGGSAFVGALIDLALQLRAPVVTSLAGAAGYVVGTGWAAAQLGVGLGGDGTFGGAIAGAALGAAASVLELIAVFAILVPAGPFPTVFAPAVIATAIALPAIGASVAFETSYHLARSEDRARLRWHPTVVADGRRTAIGIALDGRW